jgi:hypothetical protein
MTQSEKMELAARYSAEVSQMAEELDALRSDLNTRMSTMDAGQLATTQARISSLESTLEEKADEIAAAISRYAASSMQTQGMYQAPSVTYGRPTAIEGPHFWFDIR